MKFGIVGCGFIAEKHAKAIETIEGAELVAVCDKEEARMTPFINEYGAKGFAELNEMLREDLDIVCVCTPSGFHSEITIEIANSKKHIIVEKPIAMNLEESTRMIRAAEVNNVKLQIVHPNRFRPVVTELKSILDNNLLGKISHANCLVNWNRNQEYYDQAPWRGTKQHDGGVLMNQAIHNIDLLIWFLGTPSEIFGMEATRLRDIEAEDVSCGLIRFEDGSIANIQASTTVYPQNFEESITIFGEKGTVKIGGRNALYFEEIIYEGIDDEKRKALIETIQNNPWGVPGHVKIIEDMIDSIINEKNPVVPGEEGERALKLVLKLYESAEKKEVVLWD